MLRIDTLQKFWKPFVNLIIAGPHRTLVLRASAGFPFRHTLVRPERHHAGASAQRLQIALRESADRIRDVTVWFHQKQRGNVGDPEGVAGRIVFLRLIKQGGKRYTEAMVEPFCRAAVVLRYSNDLDRRACGQPLQERKSELADWATHFVKREQHGPLREKLFE